MQCNANESIARFKANFPPSAWPIVREKMLLPIVHVIAMAEKRLEKEWLICPPILPLSNNPHPMVEHYCRLCCMLNDGVKEANATHFFAEFFNTALEMVRALFVKEKSISPDQTTRMLSQLMAIEGVDCVLKHVRKVAEDSHRKTYITLFGVVEYFKICGALPHALQLARTLIMERPDDSEWVGSLGHLISHVEDALKAESDRRLSVAMSLLCNAPIAMLGPEMLQIICCNFPSYPVFVCWKDLVELN
jgi:hypothetical protein